MWKLYAVLSALFAALTTIFAKIGVKDIDSNLATAIRVTVIVVIAWGAAFIGGSAHRFREVSATTLSFLILSAIATGLSWLFYFKALQLGDTSRVASIDKLSLPLIICFSALFLHEPTNLKTILGGICITIGSIILVL